MSSIWGKEHAKMNEKPKTAEPNEETQQDMLPAKKKRKKVVIACVYCRRSHMICDEQRPCSRCIKRNIGHLCHDQPVSQRQRKKLENVREGSVKVESDSSATLDQHNNGLDVQPVPADLQKQLGYSSQPTTLTSTATGTATTTTTTTSSINNNTPNATSMNPGNTPSSTSTAIPISKVSSVIHQPNNLTDSAAATAALVSPYNQQPMFFSEHAGSEFSSLNEFLSMLDDPELNISNSNQNGVFGGGLSTSHSLTNLSFSALNSPTLTGSTAGQYFGIPNASASVLNPQSHAQPHSQTQTQAHTQTQVQSQAQSHIHAKTQTPFNHLPGQHIHNDSAEQHISDSARDKFFLTAADPTTEISPEERLKQVINAKLEAGLLQPYNYAKGYARLQAYMDNYMNHSSKHRILKPLSIFRPAFRAIARTLKDVDLILVEESFERMLLDYDRVFTSMAIPACLWRRTGEIYRGNKEFASLVEVSTDDLRDGKLAIYELMSEESAVNFWEKYGAIAFDKGQKAVLTSCNLRTRDGRKRKTCCFSFTIRRDRYNIPSCIVGNFIPINP